MSRKPRTHHRHDWHDAIKLDFSGDILHENPTKDHVFYDMN